VLRGFIRESVSLLFLLVGLWLAWHYAYVLYPYLGGVLAEPGLREWVARLLMLALVLLVGAAVGALVRYLVTRAAGLAVTDRVLGLLFGAVRACVIIGIFVMVGQGLDLAGEPWWKSSRLMPYAEHLASWLERYAEPAVGPLLERATGG
jgi:membrane protein required for colicin V production